MYEDHEFDPVTPEEAAERKREQELARAVRREVVRIQRGEAVDDLQADAEAEQTEREEQQEAEQKAERRRSNPWGKIFRGDIIKDMSEYYRYMLIVAVVFFASIVVIFTSLHLDMKYTRLEREVQMLRERSIRLQEQRYRLTTHSAILDRLRERGIELYDPLAPGEIIED